MIILGINKPIEDFQPEVTGNQDEDFVNSFLSCK